MEYEKTDEKSLRQSMKSRDTKIEFVEAVLLKDEIEEIRDEPEKRFLCFLCYPKEKLILVNARKQIRLFNSIGIINYMKRMGFSEVRVLTKPAKS